MASRDTLDRVEDKDLRLVRYYVDGDNSNCPLCSKVSLPLNDCTQEIEDKWRDFSNVAGNGCYFCNFVYRCTVRYRTVLQMVPRRQISRTIRGDGFHQTLTLRMPPLPRDRGAIWPYIDSIRVNDLIPYLNPDFKPEDTTDTAQCAALSYSWLNTCLDTHDECRRPLSENPFTPKRLMKLLGDLKFATQFTVIETGREHRGEGYAALSYCWGGAVPMTLTTETTRLFKAGVELSCLPKTLQDAAIVCQWLGIRYLWIDALCIIQDSEQDWKDQAFQMHSVYANAIITIAAANASSTADGLFSSRDTYWHQVPRGRIIDSSENDKDNLRAFVDPWLWEEEIELSLWNSRAWVLQERLMSHRTLLFGSEQLFWQCRRQLKCELFPNGFPPAFYERYSTNVLNHAALTGLVSSSGTQISYPQTLDIWGDICNAYMERKLTRSSDRIVALAGVAQDFCQYTRTRYILGLWEKEIEQQLLWKTLHPTEASRPWPLRCPSWSFLSIEGAIEWFKHEYNSWSLMKDMSINIQLEDNEYAFGPTTRCDLSFTALNVATGFLEPSTQPRRDYPEFPGTFTMRTDRLPQQLRFVAEDCSFVIDNEQEFWLYLDSDWTVHGQLSCALVPLILNIIELRPWLYGLILHQVDDIEDKGLKLTGWERMGTFHARLEAACVVGRHSSCKGQGCDFVALDEQRSVGSDFGTEIYTAKEQKLYHTFTTGAYKRQIALV